MATRRRPPFRFEDPRSYVVDLHRYGNWLPYCTVRLDLTIPGEDGHSGKGSGTAFFFSVHKGTNVPSVDYLVTNKHVIENVSELRIALHTQGRRDRRYFRPGGRYELSIKEPEAHFLKHADPDVDLCAIPVDALKELAGSELEDLYYAPIGDHALLSDEDYRRLYSVMRVAMVGYPIGLWDEVHNLPVVRIGHTATHAAVPFEGSPYSLVDIAVFPGSSGSPVLFWEPDYFASIPRLLGVLFAGHRYDAQAGFTRELVPTQVVESTSGDWINVGCVVRSKELCSLFGIPEKVEKLEDEY